MYYILRFPSKFDGTELTIREPITESEVGTLLSWWRENGWFTRTSPQVLVSGELNEWRDVPPNAQVEDVYNMIDGFCLDDGRP